MKDSELDREGFDAEGYVRGVLGREGIAGLLGVEGGLVAGMCFPINPLRFGLLVLALILRGVGWDSGLMRNLGEQGLKV